MKALTDLATSGLLAAACAIIAATILPNLDAILGALRGE